ncbi:hypothetical protein ACP70R_011084 [Stipagrostis hirtigluma subsp. patula]
MQAAARKLLEAAAGGEAGSSVPDDRDVIIILASLLCALICVLGIGLVARCTCGRGGTGPRAEAAAANRGVKKSVLRAIPTVRYVAATAGGGGGDEESGEAAAAAECAICLAEFEDGESMRVLPQCGHQFHAACIDKWLRGHSSCPSCRQIIVIELPPGEKCRRCGARPAAGAGAGWKPTHYSDMPPLLP